MLYLLCNRKIGCCIAHRRQVRKIMTICRRDTQQTLCGFSSVVRALPCHGRGQELESPNPHHNGTSEILSPEWAAVLVLLVEIIPKLEPISSVKAEPHRLSPNVCARPLAPPEKSFELSF